jgi:aspartyl-tRNA(Asn)/glutamyl-tRNA(Gln) amidotransferase subunit B
MQTPPNSLLHPYDMAIPGWLPQLSKTAVHKAVLAAAALQCDIQATSRFERKHYAYADLPHSYQVTQQRWPLAVNGLVNFTTTTTGAAAASTKSRPSSNSRRTDKANANASTITCRIDRLQLECDTAKTTTSSNNNMSLIDFQRAGCALLEIVTQPDLRSSPAAAAMIAHVRDLLRHTGVCQGKMEQGQVRVDVNVNLERLMDHKRSPRVEVKNLNSIQQVTQAIDYEAIRQAEEWSTAIANEQTMQYYAIMETRTWDVLEARTRLIRRKDAADDYRFLPEPDLPPLVLNETSLDGLSLQEFIAANLPELPTAAIQRLQDAYGISSYHAQVIAGDPPAIRFLDNAIAHVAPTAAIDKGFAQIACNLLCNELFAFIKDQVDDKDVASVAHSSVSAAQLGELAWMQHSGDISSTMAKKILAILFVSGDRSASPRQVAADHGFRLVSNPEELLAICQAVITDHPEELDVYCKGGKFVSKMVKLFTGKSMAACRGNAHPERLQEAVEQALEEAAAARQQK